MWHLLYIQWTITHTSKRIKCHFATTWMGPQIIILNEIRNRKTNTIGYITYMWNLKFDTNELIYKTERDSQTQKTNMVTKADSMHAQSHLTLQPHGGWPVQLFCPWDFPGKNTAVAISFSRGSF